MAPAAAPGRVLARGLAASGGGGAAGPSDHLWKRRGGGCLRVQLQPTNGAYFGAPAAPASRRTAPRRCPRSRWAAFPGTGQRGAGGSPLLGSVSSTYTPQHFPLATLCVQS